MEIAMQPNIYFIQFISGIDVQFITTAKLAIMSQLLMLQSNWWRQSPETVENFVFVIQFNALLPGSFRINVNYPVESFRYHNA